MGKMTCCSAMIIYQVELNITYTLMIKQILLTFLCLLLIICQQNDTNPTTLTFNSSLELSLDAGVSKQYSLSTEGQKYTNDLFIYARPKDSDPFEVPYLTISSTNSYQQHCYSAHAQFAGVCKIKANDLISHESFKLAVKCLTACTLQLQTYLSKVVKLELGSSLDLYAYQDGGLTEIIHVEVGEIDYTSLVVMAVVLNLQQNIEKGEEGVELLVNYGNDNIQDPDDDKYQERGSSLNGMGKGSFIHKNKSSPKLVKAYLKLKKGMNIRFSIVALKGEQFQIELGRAYYDYATKQQNKTYLLQTSFKTNKSLEIVFDVYSGIPQFLISFNYQFTRIVEFTRKSTAMSVLISPQIQLKYNYTGNLYIRVVTPITAEYYFYVKMVRDDVTYIQPYLNYFDQIESDHLQNYILFERFRYPQNINSSQYKNYSFKVEPINGKGSFYFKRCPTLQFRAENNPTFGDCLLKNSSQLKDRKFYDEQIQNKHIVSDSLIAIYMNYDITKCTEVGKSEGLISVLCAFHIIILGESSQPFEFSFLPQRKYLTNYLREGKIIKQYIPKENYAYYVFSLPNIAEVDEINVFLTTLSGDAALIISNTEKLPTLNSNAIKQSGSKSNIVLSRDNIAKEIYISVYAYQFTEINLGVIVHRAKNPGSVHQIPLQRGNIQSYVLNSTQKTVFFIIHPQKQEQIYIFLNEITGHVKMTLLDPSKKEVKCDSLPEDRLLCKFNPEKNKNYTVKVQQTTSSAKFTITYTSQNACFSSHLNNPLYISLPPGKTMCYSFALNRLIDLEYSSSFTHLQVLDKQISTNIYFNQKFYSSITTPHHTITLQNMHETCSMGFKTEGFPSSCKISIQFTNNAEKDHHFSFILEQQDADIALFDGVNQAVRGINAQSGDGKNFYYQVKTEKMIQLFFRTQSLKSHYFLAAKFISNNEFLSRNQVGKNIYLEYVPVKQRSGQNDGMRNNYYSSVLGMTGLEVISIGRESILKYCEAVDCYLVLSIYAEAYQTNIDADEDSYEIEVTQEETVLPLGQTKVGTINKGDIYTYVVNPQDAIIQFRMLNVDGKKKMCMRADAGLSNGTIIKGNELKSDMQVLKADKIQRILVIGEEDWCQFQISYISNTNPYRIVRLSHPYELNLSAGKFQRFVYYHQNSRTFKVAPMVSAGSITVYMMPIKEQNLTLLELSNLSLSEYPIITNYNGEYTMRENDPNFCSKCYYFILITTSTKFVGQILFLRLYDPIPLTTNHMFKEHLVPLTALGVENYLYYSLTSFNITFNMQFGKMEVVITNPKGQVLVNEDLDKKKTYSFKSIDYEEKDKVEFYSERAKYKIRVAVIDEAEFYIEVNRLHETERLFEGYPSTILLRKEQVQIVEFINSQHLDKPLNLMVNIEESQPNEALLVFTYRAETKSGEIVDLNKLLKNITQSDNTYIINLVNLDGRYFINIRSSAEVNATFILTKALVTHIKPKESYLFNIEGVYQVYSNYRKIIVEVFNCQGELTLLGSMDERDMQEDFSGSSPIDIRRPNYGGHYVFSIQLKYISYYIRINNLVKSSPLEYLINYYYYEDINPYQIVDTSNYQITFSNKNGQLELSVNTPTIMDYKKNSNRSIEIDIGIVKITYKAYLSRNRLDLNRYSRCGINGEISSISSDSPIISIGKDLLEKINVKDSTQKIYASVQASIDISVKHSDETLVYNFPKTLTIHYNSIEVSIQKEITTFVEQSYAYWFTDSFLLFIGWMFLPFILASTTLYYLLKYCARRLMMAQKNMVEEVEIVASSQTVPTQQKMGEAGNSETDANPQSGTKMIKQHI